MFFLVHVIVLIEKLIKNQEFHFIIIKRKKKLM